MSLEFGKLFEERLDTEALNQFWGFWIRLTETSSWAVDMDDENDSRCRSWGDRIKDCMKAGTKGKMVKMGVKGGRTEDKIVSQR